MGQAVRHPTENHQRDPVAPDEVLLIWHILVHRNYAIETGTFGSEQQISILQTSQSSVPGSLALMTHEQMTQALIDALIEQKPHY